MKKKSTNYFNLARQDYQILFLEKEKYKDLYEKYKLRYEMEHALLKEFEKKSKKF